MYVLEFTCDARTANSAPDRPQAARCEDADRDHTGCIEEYQLRLLPADRWTVFMRSRSSTFMPFLVTSGARGYRRIRTSAPHVASGRRRAPRIPRTFDAATEDIFAADARPSAQFHVTPCVHAVAPNIHFQFRNAYATGVSTWRVPRRSTTISNSSGVCAAACSRPVTSTTSHRSPP